ncbi:hypothetical protein [Paenibacillus urinalis]|uniref:hypothetical protein n=1 Tax=Paenibacillus urinalis TaxID=521520 RepID=UPI00195FFD4C
MTGVDNKLNTISKIDLIVLTAILVNVFFLRYINVFFQAFYFFDCILFLYIFANMIRTKFRIGVTFYLSIVLFTMIVGQNLLKFGIGQVAAFNLLMVMTPLVFVLFLVYLKKKYTFEALESLAFKLAKFMNYYFFFNTLIIVVQIQTGTFLMEKFIAQNPLVFDHMTGLIGLSGVSVLNFLWIATLLFNLYFYIERKKTSTLLLIIFQGVSMTVISTLNDNRMFAATFFMFLAAFVVIITIRNKFGIGTLIKFSAFGLLLAVVLWLMSTYTTVVQTSLDMGKELFNDKPSIYNERAYFNYLAFNYYDADDMGIGLNNIDVATQTIDKHLTVNNTTIVLIQGGLMYLLSITLVYTALLDRLFSTNIKGIKRVLLFIMLFIVLLVSAYATQIYRDQYTAIVYMLIYFVFYLACHKQMKEKKKKAQIQHIPLNYHERAALRKAVEFRQSLKG